MGADVNRLPSIFVGTEKGILKGIYLSENSFQNLNGGQSVQQQNEITCMCPVSDYTEVLCGLLDRKLRLFDSVTGTYTPVLECNGGSGKLRSVAVTEGRMLTAVESGCVQLWDMHGIEKLKFEASNDLHKMCTSEISPSVATGGKENPLKLWDVSTTCGTPVFTAKNVRPNWLDLRQPVWVTDIKFLADSRRLVTATGYHQVRVYDPKAQRRPVIEILYGEKPLSCLCLTPKDHYVIAGNTEGAMALFDLRNKGQVVHVYKGFAGSITGIQCHDSQPLVASCSLDRFVRVHHVDSRELLHKIYIKSRANCLLLNKSSFQQQSFNEDEETENGRIKSEPLSPGCTDDELWNEMSAVSETTKKPLKRKQVGSSAVIGPIKPSKKAKLQPRRPLADDEPVDEKRHVKRLKKPTELEKCAILQRKLKPSAKAKRSGSSAPEDQQGKSTDCSLISRLVKKRIRCK